MLSSRRGQPRPTGQAQIVSDPEVRRWFENLKRGSPGTADVYLRRLGAICERVGKSPAQLGAMDDGDAYRLLLDFVTAEEKRGATGSFISHSVTVARSWLTYNGKPQVRRIKIRAPDAAPTLQDERVPEPSELRQILLAAPPQWRAAGSSSASAQLRLRHARKKGDY
jgi:hypothetical protein